MPTMKDHCPECGFDGRDMTVRDISRALRSLPPEVQRLVDGAEPAVLRRRPDPSVWSAVEYLGHLREVMAYHRFVIEQIQSRRETPLDAVDPDASVAAGGYADADPSELLGQLSRRVGRISDLLESIPPDRMDLAVVGSDGAIVDVHLAAGNALHEGDHHLGDIRRLIG
jgi:hypothetical protein